MKLQQDLDVFIKKEPLKLKMCQDLKEKYENLKKEIEEK